MFLEASDRSVAHIIHRIWYVLGHSHTVGVTRTRLFRNNLSILVPLSYPFFKKKSYKSFFKILFYIFVSPMNRTLTLMLGMGVGGGPFTTPRIQQISPNLKQIRRTLNNLFFLYVFPLEGNFVIDAGDGGEQSQIPKTSTKTQNRIQNSF